MFHFVVSFIMKKYRKKFIHDFLIHRKLKKKNCFHKSLFNCEIDFSFDPVRNFFRSYKKTKSSSKQIIQKLKMDHVTPACARNICNSTSELEIMEILRGVISAVFIKKVTTLLATTSICHTNFRNQK